jgi:hypothetical protein
MNEILPARLTELQPTAGRKRIPANAFSPGSITMLDLILLALGLGFFALSVGYAYACDRL